MEVSESKGPCCDIYLQQLMKCHKRTQNNSFSTLYAQQRICLIKVISYSIIIINSVTGPQ